MASMSRVPYTRPGPLQDLPLERFTQSAPSTCKSPQIYAAKQSSISPTPLSTAKRRMLMLEGAISPKEHITLSSVPISSLGPRISDRKISFGPLLDSVAEGVETCDVEMLFIGGTSPRRRSPRKQTKLASSPIFKSYTGQPPLSISSCTTSITSQTQTKFPCVSSSIGLHSVHYPGFDIHVDNCALPSSNRNRQLLSMPDCEEAEGTKENIPPTRKPTKTRSSTFGNSLRQPPPLPPFSQSLVPDIYGPPRSFSEQGSDMFDHFGALACLEAAFEDPTKPIPSVEQAPSWILGHPYDL